MNHKNTDISIIGQFKNFLVYPFTILQCIIENFDNCLDNHADRIECNIYEDKEHNKNYLIFASNGVGLNKEELEENQVMSRHREIDLQHKQGRFGTGYAVSRSIFTNNKGKTIFMSCHTPYTGNGDKFASHNYAQCIIDMDESMKRDYIHKELNDEIGRSYTRIWDLYSIDKKGTGVVLAFEISENMKTKLYEDFNHPDIDKNICFGVTQKYYPKLCNDDLTLKINDLQIEPMRYKQTDCYLENITNVYKCTPEYSKEINIPEHANPEIIETEEKFYYTYGSKTSKKINKKKINSVDKTNLKLEYTILSRMCINKTKFLDQHRSYFKAIGIDIGNNLGPLVNTMFGDFYKRNNKILSITKDETPLSGDKDKYSSIEHVMNIIEPHEVTGETDNHWHVNINKSILDRVNIDNNSIKTLHVIKRSLNRDYFYNKMNPKKTATKVKKSNKRSLQSHKNSNKNKLVSNIKKKNTSDHSAHSDHKIDDEYDAVIESDDETEEDKSDNETESNQSNTICPPKRKNVQRNAHMAHPGLSQKEMFGKIKYILDDLLPSIKAKELNNNIYNESYKHILTKFNKVFFMYLDKKMSESGINIMLEFNKGCSFTLEQLSEWIKVAVEDKGGLETDGRRLGGVFIDECVEYLEKILN